MPTILHLVLPTTPSWSWRPGSALHGAAMALQVTLGAASLALAYRSYELFEKRFLGLKRLFKEKPVSPAAGGAAGP